MRPSLLNTSLVCVPLLWILISRTPSFADISRVENADYGATLVPSPPDGEIVVPASPGELAAAIASHDPGSTFFLKAGIHTGNGVLRPKSASSFVGESGAILDGEGKTTRCFVHDPELIGYSDASPRYGVTLRNLVIRNYVPADQDCAVMATDTGRGWSQVLTDAGDRNGWLLDHCTFASNRAGGAFLGSASTARNCLAADNGQLGYKGTGRNLQFLDCRATGNNKDRKFNYFVEAGGIKCWNVKGLLIDGGEYDHNGGSGIWLDYTWDQNVIRNARFHDNLRAGLSIEMTIAVEIIGCTLSGDDTDGIAGTIPAPFRPWDKSPRSGPDLRTGEIFIFDGSGEGTYVDPASKIAYPFAGKTWIHANHIIKGGGGIVSLYQGRGSINPLGAQMMGSSNGPVGGLRGLVVENNNVECASGYAAEVITLPNRDFKDAQGSWGPIPATEARAQFVGAIYRGNTYSGELKFCVPKAATLGGSNNIWDWNDRADVDLSKWKALGKD